LPEEIRAVCWELLCALHAEAEAALGQTFHDASDLSAVACDSSNTTRQGRAFVDRPCLIVLVFSGVLLASAGARLMGRMRVALLTRDALLIARSRPICKGRGCGSTQRGCDGGTSRQDA
jgi:hypothetical protein